MPAPDWSQYPEYKAVYERRNEIVEKFAAGERTDFEGLGGLPLGDLVRLYNTVFMLLNDRLRKLEARDADA